MGIGGPDGVGSSRLGLEMTARLFTTPPPAILILATFRWWVEFLFVFVKYAFCHSNVQKQKTTNMSIATLCFAMLYNLCYAVPL